MKTFLKRSGTTISSAMALALACTAALAQNAQPTTLSESYGSWLVNCQMQAGPEGQEPQQRCQISQNLQSQDNGQRVLFLGLTRNAENGAAQLTAIAPFGLDLSQGFAVEAGEATILEAPFQTCLPAGCIVNAPVPMEIISTLGSTDTASARMIANGQTEENPLRIQFQTNGFVSAWNRLVELTGE